jgi:dTDP-glucose 4,6-dehydratase
MKILVTGGAGFMGSYFIKYMLKNHPHLEIINYDKLTYSGNLENLKEVQDDERYMFVKGDITDKSHLERVVTENVVDVIVNFAAETHVDRSIQGGDEFVQSNVFGVYTILELVKKYSLKMIQISTDEVFGSVDHGAFNEESPMNPNSPYAASKAGGDLLCRAYFQTYGTQVMVTHSCNVMGPFQFPEKMLPLFITNLIEDKEIPIYGDGLNVREWIFVEDHARAIDFLLEKGKYGEVYNIGTGVEKTNLEMVDILLRHFGKDKSLLKYVADRKGHDKRYAIDFSKLQEMGWRPTHDFNTSLDFIIDWYQDHQEWWQNIKSGDYQEYYIKQYGK